MYGCGGIFKGRRDIFKCVGAYLQERGIFKGGGVIFNGGGGIFRSARVYLRAAGVYLRV